MRIPTTAHGITRTGPCQVSGRHLSEAPNEPGVGTNSPLYKAIVDAAAARDELLEGDIQRAARKAADPYQQERADRVMRDEVHHLRCIGGL